MLGESTEIQLTAVAKAVAPCRPAAFHAHLVQMSWKTDIWVRRLNLFRHITQPFWMGKQNNLFGGGDLIISFWDPFCSPLCISQIPALWNLSSTLLFFSPIPSSIFSLVPGSKNLRRSPCISSALKLLKGLLQMSTWYWALRGEKAVEKVAYLCLCMLPSHKPCMHFFLLLFSVVCSYTTLLFRGGFSCY